ncbi:hypothetical protein, partial [Enterobacter asburiae]
FIKRVAVPTRGVLLKLPPAGEVNKICVWGLERETVATPLLLDLFSFTDAVVFPGLVMFAEVGYLRVDVAYGGQSGGALFGGRDDRATA